MTGLGIIINKALIFVKAFCVNSNFVILPLDLPLELTSPRCLNNSHFHDSQQKQTRI